MPDFVCIGAQKAGTTWLYDRLKELPEFSLPPLKELHYFDRSPDYPSPNRLAVTSYKERRKSWHWRKLAFRSLAERFVKADFQSYRWLRKWYFSDYSDEWYLSLFDKMKGISGDITPSYSILNKGDVQRMHQLNPELRIVFILRNPLERAWSQYRHRLKRRKGLGVPYDLDDPDHYKAFFDSELQELRSDYVRTLKIYREFFPEKNIHIAFFEEMQQHPARFLAKIVDFLGADPESVERYCSLQEKANVSPRIDMPADVKTYLNEKYSGMIGALSEEFGSYCQKW